MSTEHAAAPLAARPASRPGRIARLAWLLILGAALAVYAASLPVRFGALSRFDPLTVPSGWTVAAWRAALAERGVSGELYAALRGRVQGFIDRRFYRRKYNAAAILAAFAAEVRNEVALEQLTGRLVEVVEATMQPVHAGLWLNGSTERRSRP